MREGGGRVSPLTLLTLQTGVPLQLSATGVVRPSEMIPLLLVVKVTRLPGPQVAVPVYVDGTLLGVPLIRGRGAVVEGGSATICIRHPRPCPVTAPFLNPPWVES